MTPSPDADANLEQVDLSQAKLTNISLQHADLSGAQLSHASLLHADLSGATLEQAEMWAVNMSGSQYPQANLSGTNLERSGVYREQALAQFPDLRYTNSTRWDRPAMRRERLVLSAPLKLEDTKTISDKIKQRANAQRNRNWIMRLLGL